MSRTSDLSNTFIHLRDEAGAEPVAVTRRLFARGGAKYARL